MRRIAEAWLEGQRTARGLRRNPENPSLGFGEKVRGNLLVTKKGARLSAQNGELMKYRAGAAQVIGVILCLPVILSLSGCLGLAQDLAVLGATAQASSPRRVEGRGKTLPYEAAAVYEMLVQVVERNGRKNYQPKQGILLPARFLSVLFCEERMGRFYDDYVNPRWFRD